MIRLWRCFAGCLCVLLVASCFASCALVVCAPDRIATRQAVGAYRAGINLGGVSPVTTAQNKKGGSDPTSPQPDVSDRYFRETPAMIIFVLAALMQN